MKDSRIEIRVAKDEKDRIQQLAKAHGLSAAELLLAGARFLLHNPSVADVVLRAVTQK
jgi:uncharacterized protein (DUF1778 family)